LPWLFWRWGLTICLPRLTSNFDPPDFSLPGSWDSGVSHQCPAPSLF
jgi:hypothetical protein